jgi:ABC-type branched-subunit amino acid transport system ATPase component
VPPKSLEVSQLRVSFGGLHAVDGLDLVAPAGRITGLIGPNGAGKTSTFDVCSGLNRSAGGRILFGGEDVTRIGPSGRARRGLGRTFQHMELFESMSVTQNVALGREAAIAGANVMTHVLSRPAERSEITERTVAAVDLCGLGDVADLSTGQRRLVELARCLAGPYSFLLLDEPSSGLDRTETAQFGEILSRVVAQRGVGILLVEHDMALVMEICADIYVLDFGRLLFRGSPGEVRGSSIVQAAYLGSELGVSELGVSELGVEPRA